MKKMLLICGALLAFSATAALAQLTQPGLYLGWGNCVGDGGTLSKVNACTATGGTNTMVLSWLPATAVPAFNSCEAWVYFSFTGGVTPTWWSSTCAGRMGDIGTAGPVSGNVTIPTTAVNCVDIWSGAGYGGPGAYNHQAGDYGWKGAGTAQVDCAGAMAGALALDTATEYFLFNVAFTNVKDRAADACPGCAVATCINFENMNYSQAGTAPVTVLDNDSILPNSDAPRTQHNIYWQAPNANAATCLQASPTHNATWGSIKALYR